MAYQWKEHSMGYTMDEGEAQRQYAEWRASLPWWRRWLTPRVGIDLEHILRRRQKMLEQQGKM